MYYIIKFTDKIYNVLLQKFIAAYKISSAFVFWYFYYCKRMLVQWIVIIRLLWDKKHFSNKEIVIFEYLST